MHVHELELMMAATRMQDVALLCTGCICCAVLPPTSTMYLQKSPGMLQPGITPQAIQKAPGLHVTMHI